MTKKTTVGTFDKAQVYRSIARNLLIDAQNKVGCACLDANGGNYLAADESLVKAFVLATEAISYNNKVVKALVGVCAVTCSDAAHDTDTCNELIGIISGYRIGVASSLAAKEVSQ